MVWWIIVLVLVIGAVVSVERGLKDLGAACVWAAIIMGVAVLVCTVAATGSVISYQTHLGRITADLVVEQERAGYTEHMLTERCRAYPLEKEVYESLDPTILLRLPEIKSDTFIMAQVECLVECRDEIYKLRLAANEYRRQLQWHSRRWFSTTLADPLSGQE